MSDTSEQRIRLLITAWMNAVMARDADAIVATYADDIVLFDAIPPYRTVGKAAVRTAWADCMPHFPDAFRLELRDLSIHADDDLAVAHFLCHFTPIGGEHPCGQTWMRATEGYRRSMDGWKVIHSHVSIPFNPLNRQAWFITDPDVVDQPDYGQACP